MRKKIVWNTNEKKSVISKRLQPHIANVHLIPEFEELHEKNLKVGTLWSTTVELIRDISYPEDRYFQPPFPYLIHQPFSNFSNYGFKIGTLALYLGELRVDEVMSNGRNISVIRHCFLIDGLRYLTRNLNDFVPLT